MHTYMVAISTVAMANPQKPPAASPKFQPKNSPESTAPTPNPQSEIQPAFLCSDRWFKYSGPTFSCRINLGLEPPVAAFISDAFMFSFVSHSMVRLRKKVPICFLGTSGNPLPSMIGVDRILSFFEDEQQTAVAPPPKPAFLLSRTALIEKYKILRKTLHL